jgi:hypothetical protein
MSLLRYSQRSALTKTLLFPSGPNLPRVVIPSHFTALRLRASSNMPRERSAATYSLPFTIPSTEQQAIVTVPKSIGLEYWMNRQVNC